MQVALTEICHCIKAVPCTGFHGPSYISFTLKLHFPRSDDEFSLFKPQISFVAYVEISGQGSLCKRRLLWLGEGIIRPTISSAALSSENEAGKLVILTESLFPHL